MNRLLILVFILVALTHIILYTPVIPYPLTYILVSIIWGFIVLMTLNHLKTSPISNHIYLAAIAASAIMIIGDIVVAYFLGTGLSPYDRSLKGFLINMGRALPALVGMEFARGFLIKYLGFKGFLRRNVPLTILVVASIFTLIQLNPNSLTAIADSTLLAKYLSSRLLPLLAKNVLLTYIVILGGPILSVFFLLPYTIYYYLTPLMPNIPWYYDSLTSVILPMAVLITINELSNPYDKRTIGKSEIKLFTYVAIVSILILFITGFFGIKISVVVSGSMRPTINVGDLIVVSSLNMHTSDIHVNDIIQVMGPQYPYVHRVVDIREINGVKYYVTKGDNNTDVDPVMATEKNLMGKVIAIVPYLGLLTMHFWVFTGALINYLTTPTGFASFIVFSSIVTYIVLSKSVKHNTRKKSRLSKLSKSMKSGKKSISLSRKKLVKLTVVLSAAVLLILSSLFTVYTHALPLTVKEPIYKDYSYTLMADYSYSALLKPNIVYNKTTVSNLDKIYLTLTEELVIFMNISISSNPEGPIHGYYEIYVTLEEPGEWSKDVIHVPKKIFNESRIYEVLRLNISEVKSLITQIRKETGISAPSYVITIKPVIKSYIPRKSGGSIEKTFTPQATIEMSYSNNIIKFHNLRSKSSSNPISFKEVSNKVELFNLINTDVKSLRNISYAILMSSALLFFLIYYKLFMKGVKLSEHERIMREYGDIIVNVESLDNVTSKLKISSFNDLVKLSKLFERPILHVTDNKEGNKHYYAVNVGDICYYYESSS